jgi:hypothetical protein
MTTTIKGIYKDGAIILSQYPSFAFEQEVEIVFTEKKPDNSINLDNSDRKPGFAKDYILYVSDDFDEPLEELKEYM